MSGLLEVTILGCGSSGGVPRADGDWGACDPSEPKNTRSRCSLLVRRRAEQGTEETTVLVDASPDLRLQTAAARVRRLDALLLSHDHADQTHGIDDVRAFFIRQRARIHCLMDAATRDSMLRRFGYIFESEGGYPAICEARDLPAHGPTWMLDGPSGAIPVATFDQDHGGVRSVGFRFGGVAYSSDVVGLDEAAFETLAGVEVWIVDALRWRPHPTHAHVERALEWIARVKPQRAILTNLHIDLDYNDLKAQLPQGVEPAYDGLVIEHRLGAEFA
ncbi:MAG: MBL fold metallo-hydrolase [Phenylobacterium sp.]|jgi:phosphoribosyl 1,2-cyclic phosphate phosphodiesterase|uniref:MBL fold metallo-hydrolase n=1 Tax=Phenylobacterium sp. TaxID=1871053 RepID=UPI002A320CAA|nr:MBL fold metallo-hydrolase [Phenylobacterium sp.]MDD3837722.1 MBL fold metallo-hydrolase [Phenylobacterium sp.]MDX9998469.1 MBL fold metallo-hydrolase [Phenylobacterium sp.]